MGSSLVGYSKEDLVEIKQSIWAHLITGSSDDEIIDLLGLDIESYKQLKVQMIDDKAQELRTTPPEHVYVDYIIRQTQNINDLTSMIANFKKSKQYNAMVGAIRARADLYDKLVAKGQEFGVFRKTAERREIVAGVLVADMTNADLKAAITRELSKLERMMKRYGDSDIIDIVPDSIHYGPQLKARNPDPLPDDDESAIVAPPGKKKKKTSKTARAKTSRSTKANRGRKPFPQ